MPPSLFVTHPHPHSSLSSAILLSSLFTDLMPRRSQGDFPLIKPSVMGRAEAAAVRTWMTPGAWSNKRSNKKATLRSP